MDEQVTLSGYADQVRELIRHDRNDEAIAICKYILRYYPKYIDAYRQMGEALLEKHEYDDAKDVFCRVLSADPENAIAYVGLATIFEREQVINEAAWNMERAFELAPGNSELQQELARLYNEQDKKLYPHVKLTPGALARIYAQEGLFGQAIQEFRAIIASTPTRFDVRVALAEALWRMGRVSEAAQVAQTILGHLPYCLKANLILGTAWKEAGLSESDMFLRLAQSLDPMNQIAVRLFGARSPLPALHTSVPRYVEGAGPMVVDPLPGKVQIPSLLVGGLAESPADHTSAEPTIETTTSEEPATPMTTDSNLPAWLRRSPGETTDKIESKDQVASDWLSNLREVPAEETAATPPASAPSIDWNSAPKTEEPTQPPASVAREALPVWLDSAPSESIAELPSTELLSGDEPSPLIPSWVWDTAKPSEPAAPVQTEPAPPTTSQELPSWLGQTPAPAQPPAETLPTWLAQPAQASESEPAVSAPSATAESPDWIGNLQLPAQEAVEQASQQVEASTEKPAEQEPASGWLDKLREPMQSAEQPAQQVETPVEKPAEQEPAPGWLDKLREPTQSAAEPTAMQTEILPTVFEPPTSPPVESGVAEISVAPVEPKRKRQPKGFTRLVQARAYRDAHRWNDALIEYDYLVQHAPRLVREVIDDLEMLIQHIDIPLEAHRILGDAYTRADRLAEALERYRFVLEHVS